MCKAMEDMRNESARKAEQQITVTYINDIMTKLKYTAEQAMDLLSVPQSQRSIYTGLVGKPIQ